MTLNKQIEKLINILEKSDDALLKELAKVERTLFRKIRDLLNEFSSSGTLVKESGLTQLQRLLAIDEFLITELNNSNYSSLISDFLVNFDEVQALNKSIHKGLNNINIDRLDLKGVKRLYVSQVTDELLSKTNLKSQITTPLKEQIFLGIETGQKKSVVERSIKNALIGSGNGGNICKLASQVAGDAINQYQGEIQGQINKEFDLGGYRYLGSLIKTSRPTCVRWVRLLKGQLPNEIIDEEIRLANIYNKAYGRGVTLTRDNFARLRGGFRCRHSVVATFFDEEEVEAAIKLQESLGSRGYT